MTFHTETPSPVPSHQLHTEVPTRMALRVAIDVTPLLGPPTGIYQATAGLLEGLRSVPTISPGGYVLSGRARHIPDLKIAVRRSRLPSAICQMLWGNRIFGGRTWGRWGWPTARNVTLPADVIHGTNYVVAPGRTAQLVSVNDLTPITDPQWCAPGVERMAAALRQAVRRGAHVHVTSRAVAESISDVLEVTPERTHLVPVGLGELDPGDPAAARRLVGTDRYVLALGTTGPRKGLTGLPGAMASLHPEIKLVVAGPVGTAEEELNKAVADARLGDRYLRLPTVDDTTRSDLLSGAAVLACPSLHEGFGLVPLEAASLGTPVVSTAVGALPELIGDEIKLLTPGDEAALSEALAEAVESTPKVSEALQERLKQLAWPKVAAQMAAVYQRVADDWP